MRRFFELIKEAVERVRGSDAAHACRHPINWLLATFISYLKDAFHSCSIFIPHSPDKDQENQNKHPVSNWTSWKMLMSYGYVSSLLLLTVLFMKFDDFSFYSSLVGTVVVIAGIIYKICWWMIREPDTVTWLNFWLRLYGYVPVFLLAFFSYRLTNPGQSFVRYFIVVMSILVGINMLLEAVIAVHDLLE